MKRKLIAIALACAMVFSMIPSLAFADAVPTESDVITLLKAVPDAEKISKMTYGTYKTYLDPIVAAEDAYKELKDAQANGTKAEKAAADEVMKYVGTNEAAVVTAREAYDTKIVELVEAEAGKLALTEVVKKGSANVADMTEVYLTASEAKQTLNETSALSKAQVAAFAYAVDANLSGCFNLAGELYTVPTEAVMVAVVAAYPAMSADIASDIDAIVAPVASDAEFTDVDGTALVKMYDDVVAKYNEDAKDAYNKAITTLSTLGVDNDRDYYAQVVKKARAAYAELVMDEDSMTAAGIDVTALEGYEVAYVQALVTAIPAAIDINSTDKAIAEYIAAVEAARAAHDELAAYYEKVESDQDLSAIDGTIASAEDVIVAYDRAVVDAAFKKVEFVEAVDADNKADVEAFVTAWEKYEPALTEDDKEAIEKGTNKTLKAYADKYAVLKPLLDEFVAAELQAEADKEAKIAILSTKVKNVKAVAGKKKATIKWAKNDAADGYKVLRATSKNGKFKAVKKNTTKVKFVNKKLKSGKTYYYKVVAYKTIAGEKVWSKDSKIIKVKVK